MFILVYVVNLRFYRCRHPCLNTFDVVENHHILVVLPALLFSSSYCSIWEEILLLIPPLFFSGHFLGLQQDSELLTEMNGYIITWILR